YDVSSTNGVTIQNPVGRLVIVNDYANANNFAYIMRSYDPMGRVGEQWQWSPARSAQSTSAFLVTAQYNQLGLPKAYSNETVTFSLTYGGAGRPTALTSNLVDSAHPATLASGITYTPAAAAKQLTYGNGLTKSDVYNDRLQPCRFNLNSSATILASCTAAIPSTGNIQDLNYA